MFLVLTLSKDWEEKVLASLLSETQSQSSALRVLRPDFSLSLTRSSTHSALGFNDREGKQIFRPLEDSGIFTCPLAGQTKICHPFLVIGVKAPSTGGIPFQAQNQVAVSAAATLHMLRLLQRKYGADEAADDSHGLGETNVVFSITIYGEFFSLWVNYEGPTSDGTHRDLYSR